MVKIKRSGIFVNLALVIISTIFTLLLSEVAIRFLGQTTMYVSPERDRFWRYDSLLGWTHQPGQNGVFVTPQFRTAVSINSQGLRDREYSYERQNGKQRILILGDSFAWGYGVEEHQRFSELLESSLGVEAINAGVSGYSTDQELIWFRNVGINYSPDLVIVVFAGNDIGDNSRDLVSNIYNKPMFVLENDQLVQKNYPVPRTSPKGKFVYYFSQHSALFYFLVQRYFDILTIYRDSRINTNGLAFNEADTSTADKPFVLTLTLLQEIQKIAASRDAKFLIVATDSWWNGPSGWFYNDFIDELHSQGFLVLDVQSTPGFIPGTMLIPDDGHWNAAGHEFVAGKIKKYIESDQLLIQAQNQVGKPNGQ